MISDANSLRSSSDARILRGYSIDDIDLALSRRHLGGECLPVLYESIADVAACSPSAFPLGRESNANRYDHGTYGIKGSLC